MMEELRAALSELESPTPQFNFMLGWPPDYNTLFEGVYDETADVYQIIERAVQSGRLLLTARGGGAKSAILVRVAKHAVREGVFTVLVRLKGWTALHYESWKVFESSAERLRFLLQSFAVVPVDTADMDTVKSAMPRLVIIDGLNEVDSRTGQQIINALDEYARYALNTSIIVADRFVRREFLRPDRWTMCVVQPLTPEEIRRVLTIQFGDSRVYDEESDSTKKLLALPFFLNQFLTEHVIAKTTAEQMHSYFIRQALDEHQLDRAAAAAYGVYRDSARTFKIADFQEIAGQEIVSTLHEFGTLRINGPLAYFDHHLKHDYLAARHLAQNRDLWKRDSFNRISFYASSFETIVMLMEQISNQRDADHLVRNLYDWSIYAAGYALAEGRETRVSEQMYLVILAMFAERQWDLVIATSTRARDTLHLFGTDLAQRFASARSLNDLAPILEAFDGADQWFTQWRKLFTRSSGETASDKDLDYLTDRDSVIGWTASNVLRRLNLSSRLQARLRTLPQYVQADDTVQWRVVHVLGAIPSDANARALVNIFENASFEVRYGATRSLVEMAARSSERLATIIFRELRKRVDLLMKQRGVLDEFRRAILIQPDRAPEFWTGLVAPTVLEIAQHAKTPEERDLWDWAIQDIISRYGTYENRTS